MARARQIMIVGNGAVDEGAAPLIDAADMVIRFNGSRNFGAAGRKSDVIAVCNTGRPGAAMLADPRPMGAGLAPGVGQLNAGDSALSRDETGDALQRFDLFVVPQTEVFGGDSPVGGDRRGFRENQSGTAHRAAAQVHQMPVVGQTIDARVLAHR